MEWHKQVDAPRNGLSILWILSLAALITGLAAQSFIGVLTGCLFTLFLVCSHLYFKYVAKSLKIEMERQNARMFPGDRDYLALGLSQGGWLPIIGGTLRLTIDPAISFSAGTQEKKGFRVTDIPFTLFGKQTIKINLPYEGIHRGPAKIQAIEVIISHPFGIGTLRLDWKKLIPFQALVYPEISPVLDLEKAKPVNRGDFPFRKSFYEDPARLQGARLYTPDDPFNKIHWTASARTGVLHTKVLERASQYSWTIMVDIRDPELELKLSGIAYLLRYATREAIPFQLFFNVRCMGSVPFLYLPRGTGKEHLQKAMELLAMVRKDSVILSFTHLWNHAVKQPELSPLFILSGDAAKGIEGEIAARKADTYRLENTSDGLFLTNAEIKKRKAM